MEFPINYLAIVVATVINIVLGFMWYGPIFGKQWIKEMGFGEQHMKDAAAKGMTKTYIIMAVTALVFNYVLAHYVALLGIFETGMALQLAFWTWLGFIATTMTGQVLWEGKSWTLYAINTSYYLVCMGIASVIFALWQ